MSSKRRMVLWLHAAEYDYLLGLAEAGLEGASATFKRIVQAMRSSNIRNVNELEQALGIGRSQSKDAQSEDRKAG
jgi:hypothetical protein